jgi:Fe-S cluster assembly protein SufD
VLRHVRLQEESAAATQLGLQQVRLERDATLSSHAVVLGGGLTRTEVDATLDGEGADCGLDGLYLVDGRRHVDHNVLVRHARPHGSSRQLYKGVLEGRARAVFNGRIVVDHGAQRTDARQANRNLLLSDDALVNSNPQLEIFADDVRCTHGSTVGRLDQEAVFYLRSRGIGRAAAESLLTYAFAAEVVQRIPVEEVRERLERHLFARLPRGEVVREAV